MTEKEIGVTDEPVKPKDNESDKLNIGSYIGALETFIKNTKTPITIEFKVPGEPEKPHCLIS